MTNLNGPLSTAAALVLFVLLAAAVATDLRSHRIPNMLLLPALSLALMLHTMTSGTDGLIVAATGLTLGLAMLFPFYLAGGIAAGDVKLLGVVGSFVGPWGVVVSGLATMMAGAVFGVAVIVWQRLLPALESRAARVLSPPDTGLRTAPVAHSLGQQKRITYIPYAPAIAAGTVAALWYLGYLPDQIL
ncbi:MAG: A24 family peptidase [Gammaproteobacteria bacterium]|nr:A24 family peptidase [Gammaproteobacteria bacterium]MDH3416779.1 A24 family peptidase [Gammaproteobacteria bacterium]